MLSGLVIRGAAAWQGRDGPKRCSAAAAGGAKPAGAKESAQDQVVQAQPRFMRHAFLTDVFLPRGRPGRP